VKAAGRSGPRRYETAVAGGTPIRSKSCRTTLLPYAAAAITLAIGHSCQILVALYQSELA
jgi:hypothetical protein